MADIRVCFSGRLEKFELDVDFEIPAQGVTALFGQSGCGKTTVLRCMAGLEQMERGTFQVGSDIWQDQSRFLKAHERAVGYVFQDANLFDHLTVRGNLEFALKRRFSNDGPTFDEVADLMGLKAFLDRRPVRLSGGEKQRVAIARALLSAPRLLLMDEPLSALDRFSKDEIIPYLDGLSERFHLPVVFVSHDTDEVERLADHLIVMEKGRVVKDGALLDVLSDPDLFIAKSAKTASLLEAQVIAFDPEDSLSELSISGGTLFVPGQVGDVGEKRRVRLAATDISLAQNEPSETTILNILKATILEISPVDDGRYNVVLAVGENRIIARISKRSLRHFGFEVGQSVFAQVKGVSMVERRQRVKL